MAYKPANRKQYYNMTEAEVLRSLSDNEINRYASIGVLNAVKEQAYRHSLHDAWDQNNVQRSEFERACMVEAETRRQLA